MADSIPILIATVFRGADALGTVHYNFTLHDDGRLTGTVGRARRRRPPTPSSAPRVLLNFLPQSVVETDLHLRLSDGTAVDFLIANTTGRIASGRRRQE